MQGKETASKSYPLPSALAREVVLEVYSQARIRAKREAQEEVVEMIMTEDTKVVDAAYGCG